ncbi:hypothetical protein [Limnochorda pilosa]|nr:hypothetical protein [Limnochorda pilosa]
MPGRGRSRSFWAGGAALLVLLVGAAVTAYLRAGNGGGTEAGTRLQAYTDSRPGLVFVYTTKPHPMPDGTLMY